MVQLLDGTGDVPEFASPVSLLQPWLTVVSAEVQEAELEALQHAVNAAHEELAAFHHAQQALLWVQQGVPEFMTTWFTAMTHDIGRASWHWGKAAEWLHQFGDERRVALYQPLYEQVAAQQHRLTCVAERYQVQILRYYQEWGLALPEQPEQAG